MELRQLANFVAVAVEKNISRAAAGLRLTQPALSRQIRALEEELGVTLLDRGAHSIRLTAEGELLLREARAVLDRAALAVERVRRAGAAPVVRLGYAPTLSIGILAPALADFSQRHPRVRIEMLDLSSAEMLTGLAEGKLDLVVTVMPPVPPEGTVWHRLRTIEMRLALSRGHALAARETVEASALNGEKLVLYCRKDYPEYWQRVTEWFRANGVNAKVAGEYDGAASLVSAVEAGLGAALVTDHMALPAGGGVVLRRVTPAPESTCIAAGLPDRHADDPILTVLVEDLRHAAAVQAAG